MPKFENVIFIYIKKAIFHRNMCSKLQHIQYVQATKGFTTVQRKLVIIKSFDAFHDSLPQHSQFKLLAVLQNMSALLIRRKRKGKRGRAIYSKKKSMWR